MQQLGVEEEDKKVKKDWWKDSEEEDSSSEEEDSSSEEDELSASDSDSFSQPSRPVKTRRVQVPNESNYSRFKTLEQLLQEQGEEDQEVKPLVFTDHTGKEDTTRIVGAGLNPIQVDRNAIGFEVWCCKGYDGQMIYNLESLTAQEENRILQYGSKNRRQESMKQEKLVRKWTEIDLQQLLDQLKVKMETDSANMMSLTELVQRIQRFLEESKLLPPHPLDVLSFFEEMQIDFPVEYYRYKVFQLLPWTLQPSIEQEFKDWNPLEV